MWFEKNNIFIQLKNGLTCEEVTMNIGIKKWVHIEKIKEKFLMDYFF